MDGQKVGWIMNSARMGSPGGRGCEALCGLRSVVCSQSARRKSRTGRAHVFAWGTPRSVKFAVDVQGDVMAARVVGIRQEGESLPDGAVQEGRGTRAAAMTSRARCKVRELRVAAMVLRDGKKKVENKRKPRFRVNRIPEAGVKAPLPWAQDTN